VKLLLSKPWPEINSINGEGVTALQMACQRGLYDAAVAMLKAKADPTIFKGYGKWLSRMLKLLFSDWILCARGEPVLFAAVYSENPGLVKALLEGNKSIDLQNYSSF
jgi:hypothetical protein